MRKQPKRQHFLPRFYLRGFGDGDEVRIRRRDGAHFTTGTAAVGHERFMYDHPDLPAGAVETDYLKGLDTRASEAFEAVRGGDLPGRLAEERWDFSHFLAVQMTRTPERRAQVSWEIRLREFAGDRELTRELVREYLREEHLGFEPEDGEVVAAFDLATYMGPDFTDDDAKRLFLQMMLEPPEELIGRFVAMDWTLEIARKPRFITSDSPLVMWREPTSRDNFEGVGVANAEEVRFPLDAGCQLVLTQPGQGDGRREVEPQRVRSCNHDMALGCHEFIVGHPRREHQLARIELPEHRPILRFNSGPMLTRGSDGKLQVTGKEVLHTWLPRR